MTAPLARKIEGKKFMWDGVNYESRDAAEQALLAYKEAGFEAELVEDEEQYFVYSRRLASEQSAG
ncbi:MAG: hypothetical protein WAU47_00425 [Desulfobaccales bacterium]